MRTKTADDQTNKKGSMRDMTSGNPAGLILAFALPLLMGTLFQQFYSMVDTIIVGQYLGVNSLAAVGSTGAVNFLVNGFVIGMCSGFAIPVAQRFGAKDYKDMRRYTANVIWLCIIFAAAMTIAVSLLTRQILLLMNTPAEILDEAYKYIFIIFLGIPVTFLYNTTAGVIRALGDSRTPVFFLVLASVMNIILDFVSIVILGMGVEGPALATVFSQGVSGILCLIYMTKKFPILKFERDEIALSGHHCAILCKMSIPMGLQYSITAIGSVVLQTAVNGLGATAVAAMTAGLKISMFFCSVFEALGTAMATYCGQNIGAGKTDRIVKGVKAATIMGFIYSAAAFAILFLLGGKIPLLFVSADEVEVIRMSRQLLVYNSAFYFLLTIVNVWRFSLQGMGLAAVAVIAGVLEMGARAIIGFVCIPMFGFGAACFASPLAWLFATAFLIPEFFHAIRKMKKLVGENTQTA